MVGNVVARKSYAGGSFACRVQQRPKQAGRVLARSLARGGDSRWQAARRATMPEIVAADESCLLVPTPLDDGKATGCHRRRCHGLDLVRRCEKTKRWQ